LIFFNALAATAAMAELAAMQLAGNKFEVDGNAGGQPGNPGHQGLAVRFTGGNKSQHVQRGLMFENKPTILPEATQRVKGRGTRG